MLCYMPPIGGGRNPLLEQPPPGPPYPLGRSRQSYLAVLSSVNLLVSRASYVQECKELAVPIGDECQEGESLEMR